MSGTPTEALKTAVTQLGRQASLARLVGVKQPTVWAWVRRIGRLPAEHVLKVEEATGISRHALRPDIYPTNADAPADRHNGVQA